MSVVRDFVFEDLKEEGWKPVKPSPSIRDIDEDQDFPNNVKIPLMEFTTEDNILHSNKPVVIEVNLEDGIFYATNETLNIDAEGNTLVDAIEDFSRHINYFYSYYSKKDISEVMGNATRLKDIYESHFHIDL